MRLLYLKYSNSERIRDSRFKSRYINLRSNCIHSFQCLMFNKNISRNSSKSEIKLIEKLQQKLQYHIIENLDKLSYFKEAKRQPSEHNLNKTSFIDSYVSCA